MQEYFFNLGNLLIAISSYPLIKEVIKNKNSLNGFSKVWSPVTFIALICLALGYFYANIYISVLLLIPTISFWGIVSYYKIKFK